MRKIVLTQGYSTQVSNVDYTRCAKYTWHASVQGSKVYALGRIQGSAVSLARFILNASNEAVVDHVNGDTLDNRRVNLRQCSCSQNCANAKLASFNTSGFKGVSLRRASKMWKATIQVRRKQIHLGTFSCPEAAAQAYDVAARKYFGPFAKTNEMLGLCMLSKPSKVLEQVPVRRHRLNGEVLRIPLSVTREFLVGLDAFREDFYKLTKKKISRAYIFREGVRRYVTLLRVQIGKAKRGTLHAKPR